MEKEMWKPTESLDFYRGKISECEKFIKQTNYAMEILPNRISNKTVDSKHQSGLVVAARKHVYDSILNTCEKDISEAKKMIQWIETGVLPK